MLTEYAVVNVPFALSTMLEESPLASPSPWFALHVRAKSEALVSAVLRRKGFETFAPTYLERRKYSDRIRKVETALFPGYVFCQFDPERALAVVTTPAVHRILTVDAQPAPVSPAEIESVRRASEAGLATPAPYLTAGRRVRVVFGPLAGVEGLMVAVRSPGRLIINVETLHRAIAAEVDLDHVIAI